MSVYTFSRQTIEEDPTVQMMMRRRNLSPASESSYVKAIRFFCEYYKTKPEEIVSRFRELDEDELIEEFANFFASINDRVAPKTLHGWMPGIRAWLLENGVRRVDRVSRELSREFKRKIGKPKPLLKRDAISREEITKILKICKKRERAIICTFASTGLRLSACLGLKMKHIKDDIWNPNLSSYLLEIHGTLLKGEDADPHITFISQEAAEYIRALLLERVDEGKTPNSEDFLFLAERGGERLSAKRFSNLFRELCRKANLDMKPVKIRGYHPVGKKGGGTELRRSGLRYNIRVHSLRKFMKTACSRNGVDRMVSEALLGHSLAKFGVESLYDYCCTQRDYLRQEYEKVLGAVTFLKPQPIPESNRMREENQRLQERLERLERRINQGYGSPEALVEMLREHGLVATLENENKEKSGPSLPRRQPRER